MTFNSLIEAFRRWNTIRQTEDALSELSRRELDDLGIGRWQIHDIAVKAANCNDVGRTHDAA